MQESPCSHHVALIADTCHIASCRRRSAGRDWKSCPWGPPVGSEWTLPERGSWKSRRDPAVPAAVPGLQEVLRPLPGQTGVASPEGFLVVSLTCSLTAPCNPEASLIGAATLVPATWPLDLTVGATWTESFIRPVLHKSQWLVIDECSDSVLGAWTSYYRLDPEEIQLQKLQRKASSVTVGAGASAQDRCPNPQRSMRAAGPVRSLSAHLGAEPNESNSDDY